MALTWTKSCSTPCMTRLLRTILPARPISKTRSTSKWPSASVYGGGCLPIYTVPVRFQKPLNTICQNTSICQCAASVTVLMDTITYLMSAPAMQVWKALSTRSQSFWRMVLTMVRKNSLVRFGCTVSMMMTVCARSLGTAFNSSVFVRLIWIHLPKAALVKIR